MTYAPDIILYSIIYRGTINYYDSLPKGIHVYEFYFHIWPSFVKSRS